MITQQLNHQRQYNPIRLLSTCCLSSCDCSSAIRQQLLKKRQCFKAVSQYRPPHITLCSVPPLQQCDYCFKLICLIHYVSQMYIYKCSPYCVDVLNTCYNQLGSMSHFELKSHMTVFHILHKLCLLHKFYGMQWECSK